MGQNSRSPVFQMKRWSIVLMCFLMALAAAWPATSGAASAAKDKTAPITLSKDVGAAMAQEATRVRRQLQQQARSMFERRPLGWNFATINKSYHWLLTLPLKIPELVTHVLEQGRLLGVVGSLLVLTFLLAVFYSMVGQKRVLAAVQVRVSPFYVKLPQTIRPHVAALMQVAVASLIPLVLLGAFALINALIRYQESWFLLTGRLLRLWVIGALVINLLEALLTEDFSPIAKTYGKVLFIRCRIVLLFVLGGVASAWAAEAFALPADVLSLIEFIISVAIASALFLLMLNKEPILSLIPDLPYGIYRSVNSALHRHYHPVIAFTYASGVLWCLGYRQLGEAVWIKLWGVLGVFILIVWIYHIAGQRLGAWAAVEKRQTEEAANFYSALSSLLLYLTVLVLFLTILDLWGVLNPLQRILSFPVMVIGETPISLWIITKAGVILYTFLFVSRLLGTYLDYQVYPSIGVESGLAYAINTFLSYTIFVIGLLVALNIVGLDLRLLLVFAGAVGIGIGLGLQNLAANVISGFSIVFGQKLRKGDWIQVGETTGVVTDIFLRATKIRTRDNIEYLIPNAHFISETIINYTLSSPMIRIHIAVGVSYNADPKTVRKVLLTCAEKHPAVVQFKNPEVFFVSYGDSSINFELLVWIDVRKISQRRIRSQLYFTIFEALKAEGIEIPFPQRDLHIRSGLDLKPPLAQVPAPEKNSP